MKIEHVRVGGIYKVIVDIKDTEDMEPKVILPKGHIVQVQTVLDSVDAVMVEDLTKDTDAYVFVKAADMDYVTYVDPYGKDYQAEETKQNKDSPHYNQHYTDMIGLQPIEVMQDVLSHEEFVGFIKGNIIKYTMRAGHKQGESAEKDSRKAKDYQNWLKEAIRYHDITLDR